MVHALNLASIEAIFARSEPDDLLHIEVTCFAVFEETVYDLLCNPDQPGAPVPGAAGVELARRFALADAEMAKDVLSIAQLAAAELRLPRERTTVGVRLLVSSRVGLVTRAFRVSFVTCGQQAMCLSGIHPSKLSRHMGQENPVSCASVSPLATAPNSHCRARAAQQSTTFASKL